MTTSTLRYGRVGTTMLLVHDGRNPSAPDWSEWVGAYAQGARDHGVRGLLVVSLGGGPNGRQRSEVVDALVSVLAEAADEVRTAVCSDSRLARGITTAIGWLTAAPYLRSFGYRQRDEALAFLRLEPATRPAVLAAVDRLEGELRRLK